MTSATFRPWRAFARQDDGSRRRLGVFAARVGNAAALAHHLWPAESLAGRIEIEKDEEGGREVGRG